MIFEQSEIIEILIRLGYRIEEHPKDFSRKSKLNRLPSIYYVIEGEEKVDVRVVFKREIRKRIFGI